MILECRGCSEKYQIGPFTKEYILTSFKNGVIPYYILGWCTKAMNKVEQYIHPERIN